MDMRVFATKGRKPPNQVCARDAPKHKGWGGIVPGQQTISSLVIGTPAKQLEEGPASIDMPSLPHHFQGLRCEHVVAVDAPDHERSTRFSLTDQPCLLVKVVDEAHPRVVERQFLMQCVQLRVGPQPRLPPNPLPLQRR